MNGKATRNRRGAAGFATRGTRSGRGAMVQKASCGACGCSTAAASAAPVSAARYDDDGTCASLFDVSCETQWRLRDCLKLTLCEFLTCVADSYCADGGFQKPVEFDANGNPVLDPATGATIEKDLGDVLMECLCESVCTTLHCIPDAICGPQQSECVPPPALECDFAVEDKS